LPPAAHALINIKLIIYNLFTLFVFYYYLYKYDKKNI